MRVRVLFFGVLKDIVGKSEEALDIQAGFTLGDLFRLYSERFETLRDKRPSILFARNREFATPDTGLTEGDEVAFLPPVSGGSGPSSEELRRATDSRPASKSAEVPVSLGGAGSRPALASEEPAHNNDRGIKSAPQSTEDSSPCLGTHIRALCASEDANGHYFAITREPIQSQELSSRLQRPEDGAVVVFEGVVRNNTKGRATKYLEYECYQEMAIGQMARIGQEIARQFSIGVLGIVHRLGRLEVGEASVAVVATAPHRKPAFDAALEAINRLKREVPIWKKEFFADGEIWVEGEWDERLITGSTVHEAP